MWGLVNLLRAVDPEPVLVEHQACLRARHRRSPCRACSDVCPAGALVYEGGKMSIKPTECTRCGLCAGACPTGALGVRGLEDEALEGVERVRCARAVGGGAQLPCLGWLTADHLVGLGSRMPGLELAAGECSGCPLASGGERAQAALATAAGTLAALGVAEPPRWVVQPLGVEPAAPQERQVTRRELFTLWRRDVEHTGRSLLPDRQVNPVKLPARVPARRLRWLRRFAAPREETTLAWPARTVKDGCNGCNICVSFCPTAALTAREEADGTWRLSFQAASCVDCGTCLHLCPRRAITAAERVGLNALLSGERAELAVVARGDRPAGMGFRPER